MPSWALSLIEAVARLLVAVAGCARPYPMFRDCAVELTDKLNSFSYALEHDKDN